jgi:hypothetical protein
MTTTPTEEEIPEGMMLDSQQRLVRIENIKPIDLARNELVLEIIEKAKKLGVAVAKFKLQTLEDVGAFVELSNETYKKNLGGKKGNVTLTSYDGQNQVKRSMQDVMSFDERMLAAKALIDECSMCWAESACPEAQVIIQDAFRPNSAGDLSTARILGLRRLNIKDPKWLTAMDAITESLLVLSSQSYIRCYERAETGGYKQISLDPMNL